MSEIAKSKGLTINGICYSQRDGDLQLIPQYYILAILDQFRSSEMDNNRLAEVIQNVLSVAVGSGVIVAKDGCTLRFEDKNKLNYEEENEKVFDSTFTIVFA